MKTDFVLSRIKESLFVSLAAWLFLSSPLSYATAVDCTLNKSGTFESPGVGPFDLQVERLKNNTINIGMLTVNDLVNDISYLIMIKPESSKTVISSCEKVGKYGYLSFQWQASQSIPAGMSGRLELAFPLEEDRFIGSVSLGSERHPDTFFSMLSFFKNGFY